MANLHNDIVINIGSIHSERLKQRIVSYIMNEIGAQYDVTVRDKVLPTNSFLIQDDEVHITIKDK